MILSSTGRLLYLKRKGRTTRSKSELSRRVVSQGIAFPKEERPPIYSRGSGGQLAIPENEFAY